MACVGSQVYGGAWREQTAAVAVAASVVGGRSRLPQSRAAPRLGLAQARAWHAAGSENSGAPCSLASAPPLSSPTTHHHTQHALCPFTLLTLMLLLCDPAPT